MAFLVGGWPNRPHRQAANGCLKLRQRELFARAGHDGEIPPGGKLLSHETERLPAQSLDAVALDGCAVLGRDGHRQPAPPVAKVVGQHEEAYQAVSGPDALLEEAREVVTCGYAVPLVRVLSHEPSSPLPAAFYHARPPCGAEKTSHLTRLGPTCKSNHSQVAGQCDSETI